MRAGDLLDRYWPIHLKTFIATLIAAASVSTTCLGANPFITSIYTADPSAHVWADGRLYVYPSHDMDPARGCDLMDRYHVFSTEDMVTWRDEGEILRASQVPWGRPEGGFMWAPDCAYRNGTYYFYFPHPSDTAWNNSWKIGIATSSKPASDFKPVGYIGGLDGNAMIDPAVFMDTDGQAYLYYGGGGVCKGGKLKTNMMEIDGEMKKMEGLVDFHEATWVFKRKDTYYLTYADNHNGANRMHYAMSDSPLGPWEHMGVYLEATDCDTTHGSVVEYRGQWYQFYHNKSLSGQGNLRSMCVDKLFFNEDDTIQMVVQTKLGVPSIGTLAEPRYFYEAESAALTAPARAVDDDAASGRKSVQDLGSPNATLQFNDVDGGKDGGRATIDICYATKDNNAKLKLTVNGEDYSLLNTRSTGDWSVYSGHTSLTVMLKAGKSNTIVIGGGNGGVNVDYISVTLLL